MDAAMRGQAIRTSLDIRKNCAFNTPASVKPLKMHNSEASPREVEFSLTHGKVKNENIFHISFKYGRRVI